MTDDRLPRAGFCATLDVADIDALMARGRSRRYRAGHALFHEGQLADTVMVLTSGRVKITSTTAAGREVVLAFREPGNLLGEQSALDGEPRSATMRAIDAVEALVVPTGAFRAFLIDRPSAALALMRMLSLRLREADAQRIQFSTHTTVGRVAARLLELSDRFGTEDDGAIRIALPLSQEELAGATGSSLESVGRALQMLRSLKAVETRRREIRVLDRDTLQALCDMA